MFSKLYKTLTLATICAIIATGSVAQTEVSDDLAANGIKAALANLRSQNSDNHFAIGTLATLRAVEKTMQERWRYGIGQSLTSLPLLRLRIPQNPITLPTQPDTISNIFKQFLTEIEMAQIALQQAANNPNASFVLRIGDLWFDMDANGVRSEQESAVTLLAPLLLSRQQLRQAKKDTNNKLNGIVINFDAADVNWLLAYTHLISSAGELYLSFDPTPIWAHLAEQKKLLQNVPQNPFPMSLADAELRLAELAITEKEVRAAQKENDSHSRVLRKELSRISKALKLTKTEAETAVLLQEQVDNKAAKEKNASERVQLRFDRRDVSNQKQDLYAKSPLPNVRDRFRSAQEFGTTADLLYVLTQSLRQNPDPDHINNVRKHLLTMIAENKKFWAKVTAETDNENEWIPNDAQTSAMGINLPNGVGETWQAVLADAEKVLNGELLIPHALLPKGHGINLKAYFDNPAPLDLIPLFHGIGIYPYVEKGPRISQAAWSTFNRLMKGRASTFAIFLN